MISRIVGNKGKLFLILCMLAIVNASVFSEVGSDGSDLTSRMEGMEMSEPKEFHPINATSKSFHWILTLFILLILPSISAVFAYANQFHWSLILQFILTGYLVFEVLFLPFPDNTDNHENRTSHGTLWFLTILLAITVFVGTFINGSNLILNKFYPKLAAKGNSFGGVFFPRVYKTLSTLTTLTGWVRVSMAPVALLGFCYGKHTGQCIAHGIMGTSFVFYGFVLSLVLVIPWIRKKQILSPESGSHSQEFYDSTLMCVWGIVNTFTEHRWGVEGWSHGDYQHTAMGIIWWAGGLLGMWQTRKRNNTRSFIPALLLIFTGWAMSEHSQHLKISTKVHAMFGIALMSAGVSRIVEILFVLWDKNCSENGQIYSFQYFPPFCLVLSGVLFMSATEEQLVLVNDLGADHSSYIMVASSAAFVIFLWMQILLYLYLRLVGYDENGELGFNGLDQEYQRAAQEFELSDLSDHENN